MGWLARLLIGSLIFLGVLLLGFYVLGIRPTLAEVILVVLATSISNGVQEGLE